MAAIALGLGDGVGDSLGVGGVAAMGGQATARQRGNLVEAEFDIVHGSHSPVFWPCSWHLIGAGFSHLARPAGRLAM